MSAFVIGKDGDVPGKRVNDSVPDREVCSKRVGKDDTHTRGVTGPVAIMKKRVSGFEKGHELSHIQKDGFACTLQPDVKAIGVGPVRFGDQSINAGTLLDT